MVVVFGMICFLNNNIKTVETQTDLIKAEKKELIRRVNILENYRGNFKTRIEKLEKARLLEP